MNRIKKITALILCMIMLLGFMPSEAAEVFAYDNGLTAYQTGDRYHYDNYVFVNKVNPNESITLSVTVEAKDKTGITYQWYKDPNHYYIISNATKSTYTINKVNTDEFYICRVSDSYGNSVNVIFEVGIENGFKAYPSETEDKTSNTIDYKVRLNTKKTLSVTVEANDKEGITYRWGKGTMPDAPGEILGTGSSYTALYTEEFGVYYYCVVTDKYGNFEYCFFHLTTDNEFKAYPSDSKDHSDSITYTVDRKGSKTLSIGVDAINKTGISYHWYDNDNREISGATGSSYTLNNIEEPVTYSCRVYDRYGNKVNVYFQISIKNDIFKYLEENTVTEKTYLVNKGDPVTLDTGVNASDLNGIKITWHSARLGATASWVKISTDTTSVKTKSIDDDYIILCVLSDDYGNRLAYIFNVFIKKFDDVPAEAGYTPSVYWALNKGITAGKTSSLFDPKGGCTRAQFVTFLWRYAGSPEPTKYHTFSDVPASKSYYKAIMWAAENGITAGLAGSRAGQFGPNDICRREQCVTFMYRFNKSPKVTAADHSSISFSDVSPESYYYDAITWAAKNGITAGISSTKFGVGKDCTRSQMVSFLNRYYYYTNPAYDPHIY